MPTARMATIPAAMQASRKAFMTVHLNESKWAICKSPAAGNAQSRPQVDMLRRMPASWSLFCCSCRRLRARVVGAGPRIFLLEPKPVVFLRPVNIDGSTAHRLEGPLHADGADVDVRQHRCDKKYCDDRLHNLGKRHPFAARPVARAQQLVTGAGHRRTA